MSSVTDVAPVPATRTPEGAPRRPRKPRGGLVLGLLAWLIGFLFVLPVLWMVLTSFHEEADAATNPPSLTAPLTLQGYPSIGCQPCTSLPTDADDPRSGRWAGRGKTECGIHQ